LSVLATSRELPSTFARGVGWGVTGQFGALVIGFATSLATARILGPSDRGLLGVMLSAANVAIVVGALGVPIALGYYASHRPEILSELLGSAVVLSVVLGLIAVPITYGAVHLVGWHARPSLWVVGVALVPISFLEACLSNQLLGLFGFARYNLGVLLSRVAVLGGTIVLAGALGFGVFGALLATVIGEGFLIAACLSSSALRVTPSVSWPTIRLAIGYGSRVQVGSVFQLLNYRLDVLVLQFFRPLREVGYYVVAQAGAEVVLTLARAFQSTLMPIVAGRRTDQTQLTASTTALRHHSLLAAIAVAVCGVGAFPLVIYGYGRSFAPAITPLLILLPAMWLLGTGNVISSDLRGRSRPGLSSILTGSALMLTVLLDFVLIPPFGMIGAAVASVIAYCVYGGISLYAISHITDRPVMWLCVPRTSEFRAYAGLGRYLVRRADSVRTGAQRSGRER
jgi:stage V sporulation protein B